MKKQQKKIMIWGIIIVILSIAIYSIVSYNQKPGKLDSFAKCLKEKKATFYGTFWCPYCNDQKKMFGKSAKYLPYVECSTANGNNQLPVCSNQNIEGYPTWIFADGSRQSGKIGLKELAEKTNCELPN